MFRHILLLLFVISTEQNIVFNILDDGAIGDGITDNTQAIRRTLTRASTYKLPSTVLVPQGVFLTGSLQIPSNVTFYLARNSILRALVNGNLYPCVPSMTTDTGPCDYPFVLIDHGENISIVGEGQIEGGANNPPGHLVKSYRSDSYTFVPIDWNLEHCSPGSCRPKLIIVRYSSMIQFVNLTIANSPLWTHTIIESEHVLFDNVTIIGDRRWPNNDGIDLINSRNVIIRNSNISTGDDCIAIMSHGPSDMYNITVENMNLQSTSAGIKIAAFESNSTGNMYDMNFRNIRITDSNRGLCLAPRWGSGIISNILFEEMFIETRFFGLAWWGTGEPIYITSLSASAEHKWTGQVRNVTLRNVIAKGEQGFIIRGNTSLLENIRMENISLIIARYGNNSAHPSLDYRPAEQPELIVAKVDGLFAMDMNIFNVNNFSIDFQQPKQDYYGQCLNLTNITNFIRENIQCRNSTSFFY